MKKLLRQIKTGLTSGQSGQALILVLIFLLMGSLLLVPSLDHINTALKTGVIYENKSEALYAADAGIEDGIWQIKYSGLQPKFGGEEYYEYDFSTAASYTLVNPVNNLTTNVTIQNIWSPSNVTLADLGLTPSQAQSIIESHKLAVSGTSGAVVGQPYRVKVDFVPASGDNLTIMSVGVWLPRGFSYMAGSSTLEQLGHPYTVAPTVTAHNGGQAVVWTYNSPYPLFSSFPNFVSENGTMSSTMYVSYTPPASDPNKLPSGVPWVTTYMKDGAGNPKTNDVPISWDQDTRVYKITAIAGGTKVEAYTSRLEISNMGDAAAGDYVATGNSLLTDANHDGYYREHALSSSDATISTVPSDGDVLDAYLYWSGWRNDATSIFSDTCGDFTNWNRSTEDGSQTRVPTGDGDINGTWNTAPCWDDVDETTYNDADYMTGVTDGGGYELFTFPAFTAPDQPIANLKIYVRAMRAASGTARVRASLKVNGSYYYSGYENPGSSFSTYTFTFSQNPNTSATWTVADINGTGANPLQQFGVYSDDLNPDVDVSMVYAEVNYTSDSRWSINSSQFRGTGSASMTTSQATLTLKNGVNLSSYTPGTVTVFWNQDEGGTLESADSLYYALSGDGGTTWSSNYLAFHDDDPRAFGSLTIPSAYLTSDFKIRYYFNFNDTAEYVTLDNIKILYAPPDTSVAFSINGTQVSFNGTGDPQLGGEVTADSFSVLMNTTGYSYACKADVSKLVKTYPVVPGEAHHTGNALYTLGNVTATPGGSSFELAYAGWSLVVVYFSPQTAGHYLYLRDVFSYTSGGEDLDFDNDGTPGGDISGFVIPEPIKDQNGVVIETTAAKLTCFIGEGDSVYAGDYVALNAPDGLRSNPTDYTSYENYKLWDGITLSSPSPVNTSAHPNNVWNSRSVGMSNDGVDIDTFTISWASGLLSPGDTSLHLDIYTQTDNWNIVYFILSVRSKVVTTGTDHYVISDS